MLRQNAFNLGVYIDMLSDDFLSDDSSLLSQSPYSYGIDLFKGLSEKNDVVRKTFYDKYSAEHLNINSEKELFSLKPLSPDDIGVILEINKFLRKVYSDSAAGMVYNFDDTSVPLMGWEDFYQKFETDVIG